MSFDVLDSNTICLLRVFFGKRIPLHLCEKVQLLHS